MVGRGHTIAPSSNYVMKPTVRRPLVAEDYLLPRSDEGALLRKLTLKLDDSVAIDDLSEMLTGNYQ